MFPVYEQKKENVHILQKTSRHAPPHLHNSVEFIYVISGSMEIGMGQELFHMDEGDFAVIFPDVIHHYQVFEKGKNKSIYVWALPVITSNYMDTLQNLCPVDPVIKKADLHPDIKYVLQALLQRKKYIERKEGRNSEYFRKCVGRTISRTSVYTNLTGQESWKNETHG